MVAISSSWASVIEPAVSEPGLFAAVGHFRNGILLAGYTGELIAQLVAEVPLEHDLCCINPNRFWAW